MTRIAHFTDATVEGVNGIASSIGLLVETLTRRGHDCTVVSAGPLWASAGRREASRDAGRDDGVIWVRSMPTWMGDFRFAFLPIRTMRDRIRAWRPDIAHVHTPGPLGAAGLTVARQMGIPAIYTYHTDMHGYAKYYHVPTPVVRAGTAIYGRHLKVATARRPVGRYEVIEAANARVFEAVEVIIAPTASALHHCRIAPYAGKVRIIATPAHLPPPSSTDAEFRTRFGIAGDSPVVLFVGRLSEEKGIRLLLDAFIALLRAPDDARLLGERGRETARAYTPDRFADEILRAYRDACRAATP